MEVVALLVLLSLVLVGISLLFFLYSMKQGDHEHADRLSLMPLEDDSEQPPRAACDSESHDNKPQGESSAVENANGDHPPLSESSRTPPG